MKKTKAFLLTALATVLWSCNESAPPAANANSPMQERMQAGVNVLTTAASVRAGFAMPEPEPEPENPFTEIFNDEVVERLRQLGVCENFVLLVKEIAGLDGTGESFLTSSRFQGVVSCLESNAPSSPDVEMTEAQALGLIETCFCAGSGSLFLGGIRYFGPPRTRGGFGTPSTTEDDFSTPRTTEGTFSTPSTTSEGFGTPGI